MPYAKSESFYSSLPFGFLLYIFYHPLRFIWINLDPNQTRDDNDNVEEPWVFHWWKYIITLYINI